MGTFVHSCYFLSLFLFPQKEKNINDITVQNWKFLVFYWTLQKVRWENILYQVGAEKRPADKYGKAHFLSVMGKLQG